jgi:hypothetical protein
MVVVKLVVRVVVDKGHSGERRKRETMVEKEKIRGGANLLTLASISPPSGHEIHIYL